MFLLSIILPCYNESLSLTTLHKKALFLADNYDIEFIFLDNGSIDDTWKIMNSFEKNEKIRFIKIKKNKGYGYGIKHALGFSNGKYIGWTHSDLQTDLFDLIKVFDFLAEEKQINPNSKKLAFKGKRFARGVIDTFISNGMSFFSMILFASNKFYEINAQPSIYDNHLKSSLILAPDDYNFDLGAFAIANSKKYKFIRFPVLFPKRLYGTSHWNFNLYAKFKFILNTMVYLFKIRLTKKN